MAEPLVHRVPRDPREREEGPSFLTVVIISGVVLALFLLGAFFVLREAGSDLLPGTAAPRNPNAVLRLAEPPVRAV
jgi:hypothetical protein